MSLFKGTIEKKVMSQVKAFIKNAEEELVDFIEKVETKHDEDMKKLTLQKEHDIKQKEEDIVGRLVGKFL